MTVLVDELTPRQYNFDGFFDGLVSRQINYLTKILTDFGVPQKLLQEGDACCGRFFDRLLRLGPSKILTGDVNTVKKFYKCD